MRNQLRVGIAVVGYPAAGKSQAAASLAHHADGILIKSGDIVREGAESYFGCDADDLTSDELGEYSTMRRETDGGTYVADDIVDELELGTRFPHRPAIVSGMRDSESTDAFASFFDHYYIVWVHAPFDERLERLQKRGRQDEDGFTKEYLAKRDGRESMWGTSDLAFDADYRIQNTSTKAVLDRKMATLANDVGIDINTENIPRRERL